MGTVTLNRAHPALENPRLKLAVPLTLDDLAGTQEPTAEPLVVWDDLGADVGSLIALSEGREAAQPFHPEDCPVDAYNAALLDSVVLDADAIRKLGASSTTDNSKG